MKTKPTSDAPSYWKSKTENSNISKIRGVQDYKVVANSL